LILNIKGNIHFIIRGGVAGVQVKLVDHDEEISYVRKLSISSGFRHATTPIRALNLKPSTTSESRLIQNDAVRGVNEIYRELTKDKVDEIDSDIDKLNEFGKTLRYIFEAPKIKDEFNLLYFSYENKDKKKGEKRNKIPSDKEIEYLCNITTHPATDIIIPPMIPDLSGIEYLEFLKKFFKYLSSYGKNHTIMGYIPYVATSELREIGQFYFENGIYLFTMDFYGSYPMDSYISVNEVRKLAKAIEKEYSQTTFLHAFNVPLSRAQPQTNVASAKDILTLASGFDSFGTSHKKEPKPVAVIEKIKQKMEEKRRVYAQTKTSFMPLFRLFNRKDYGYYRSDAKDVNKILKEDVNTSVNLSELYDTSLSDAKLKDLRKGFNVERQALETLDIRVSIEEKKIRPHFESKQYGADNFRKITKLIR